MHIIKVEGKSITNTFKDDFGGSLEGGSREGGWFVGDCGAALGV